MTGVVSLNVELEPKRLEVLRELVPTMKVAALLINPTSLNAELTTKNIRVAAGVLGWVLGLATSTAFRHRTRRRS